MSKQILIITLSLLSMQPAYSMEFNKCPATHNATTTPTLPPVPEQQTHNPQEATAISSYSSEISSSPALGSSAHSIITAHYCPQTGKEEDHPVGILCLPSEVLENICHYLRLKDIGALRCSCKQFRLVWSHERVLKFGTGDLKRFTQEKKEWLAVGIAFLSNKLKDCRNPLVLDLDANKLTELPQEIQRLSHLQRLALWVNDLSQDAIRNLSTWLPNLLELNLGLNGLTELPHEIQQLSHLRKLSLSRNELTQDAIRNLCSLPVLLELNLSSKSINRITS